MNSSYVSAGMNGDGCTSCGASTGVSYAGTQAAVMSQNPAMMSASGVAGCASCGTTASSAGSLSSGMMVAPAMSAAPTMAAPQNEMIDCGPVTTYQVVMEPKYFTESRAQCVTEYQSEVRYRTRSVARQVPVEVQDFRTTTVMVPTTETKTVEYKVLVPQKNEKTIELVETVPVWNEVVDTYTVRVPNLVDVQEEYTVRVPQLRDEEFTYTVYVPQTQTQTKIQTVTNAVPVARTRTVQVCRPVTRMQTVTKDYGHWEVRVEEVAAAAAPAMTYAAPSVGMSQAISMGGCGTYSGSCGSCGGCGQVYGMMASGCRVSSQCGSCGGCGIQSSSGGCGSNACGGGCGSAMSSCGVVSNGMSSCGVSGGNISYGAPAFDSGMSYASSACAPASQTVSRRVWVPNVVTEQVPVVENVSETQEVTYTAFEQETHQVPYECTYLVYAPEQRSGVRKVVDYTNETRTRTRKVVQYSEETRTRTRKELTYKQETRTETVPYVTYTTETRTKEVTYTVNVPETKVEPITTTRYETVSEEITEEYTVQVPVATSKEVQVQVCRMVPKLVPVTIYPCSQSMVSVGSGTMDGSSMMGSGCATCGGTPTPAPAMAPTMISTGAGCAACGLQATGCDTCQQ